MPKDKTMDNDTNTIDITKTEAYKAVKAKIKAFYDKAIAEKTKFAKPTEAEKQAIASLTESERDLIKDKHQNMRLPCFTYGLNAEGIICNRSQANIEKRGPNTGKTSNKLGETEKQIADLKSKGLWEYIAPEKRIEMESKAFQEQTTRETSCVNVCKRELHTVIVETVKENEQGLVYATLRKLVEVYTLAELAKFVDDYKAPTTETTPTA